MPRILPIACISLAALSLAGCHIETAAQPERPAAEQAAPLVTGEYLSGTLWKKPVASPGAAGSNEGSSPPKGSRVEIYDRFIIITTREGTSEVSPHGWYTNLRIKRD